MPPSKQKYRTISATLKQQTAAGLNGVSIGKANRIKERLEASPTYATEFKPLIDYYENKISFLQDRDVEKEIRELQRDVHENTIEIEKLQSAIQVLETTHARRTSLTTPKHQTDPFGPKNTRLNAAAASSSNPGPSTTRNQVVRETHDSLNQLSHTAASIIPESKSDKKESSGFDVARAVAIRAYCELREGGLGKGKAQLRATTTVWAKGARHKAKKLMIKWIADLERGGSFSENLRGRHQAETRLLYHGDTFERVREWCCDQRRVTPKRLRDWVNKDLRSTLETAAGGIGVKGISKGTARRWLHRVGFIHQRKFKGAYTDGHDAPATLLARKEYVARFRKYEPLMERFVRQEDGTIDVEEPDLKSGEAKAAAHELGWDRPYVIKNVWHDEATAKPADKGKFMWIQKGDSALMAKSEGQGYMVSGFMTSEGMLTVPGDKQVVDAAGTLIVDKDGKPMLRGQVETEEDGESVATAPMYWQTGAKADGYFACDDLVNQIKNRFIPVFKSRYPPNRYKGLVHFDNATSHTAFAADALNATKSDNSTTTPVLRATTWKDAEGIEHEQSLQHADGTTKGMRGR